MALLEVTAVSFSGAQQAGSETLDPHGSKVELVLITIIILGSKVEVIDIN